MLARDLFHQLRIRAERIRGLAVDREIDQRCPGQDISLLFPEDLQAAVDLCHINRHSTKNSEAIVTSDEAKARLFLRRVDSAVVYWNASTRFSDGGEFGFGAEMGISTQKLHCRGPFALAELTSAKYEVTGSGQVR